MGSTNFQWTLAIKIEPLLGEWDPKVTGGSVSIEGSFVIFDENPNNIGVYKDSYHPKQSKFIVFWSLGPEGHRGF